MQVLTILALAIALFAILFALQNPTPVLINFFVWQFQDPLAVVILLTLAVGVAAGVLVSFPSILRRSWKIGSYKKQMEELRWQLQEKDKELIAQQQRVHTFREKHQDLLSAIGATEPKTGLLRGESAVQGVAHLLQQQASGAGPVCAYLIEVGAETSQDWATQEKMWKAIALRLHTISPPGSWLHHDGKGHFTCAVAGLDAKTASDFGESLRSTIADQPLVLEGGAQVPMVVSIGGAIANPAEHLDSYTLLQQAEAALEHARKRGRNRFRLVEARSA